ncbi:MAG: PorP/SprF family type IX secretion system membrane protein [Bacteroidota bacterium]
MTKTIPTSLLLLLFCWPSLYGQDLHFSQYYNTPLNINPALTGIFQEDIRMTANYRSQWQSVPVPFMTISGAADMKYFTDKISNGYFGGGLIFNYDQAGDIELSLLQLSLSGSYTQQLNDQNFLTAGFQAGIAQRSFDESKLLVGNQFDGEQVNANLPTRENFASNNVAFSDLSAGINWHLQEEDQRFYLNAGVAFFHLNRPKKNFTNTDTERRPVRTSLYSFGAWKMAEKVSMKLFALGQLQNQEQSELVVGAGPKYFIREERGQELAVQFTTAVRMSGELDAIIPAVELSYLAWRIGFSYDINISDFSAATNGAGGPEMAIRYAITRVKPLKTFKACPIF